MRRRAILIHVVMPVALGAGIYLFWRSPSLLLFRWFEFAGLSPAAAAIRSMMAGVRDGLPRVILFSAPDALWVYALTSAMLIIWREHLTRRRAWLWISAALVLSLVTEIGQALHLVSGTFDSVDLSLSFAAAICAVAIAKMRMEDVHAS